MSVAITIRRARPEEAALVSDLIFRAKAHWGYDPALLEVWRPQLTLAPEVIARDPVYLAVRAGTETGVSQVLGVIHYYPLGADEVLLDDLFVAPEAMGQGVGALLWRFALARARVLGARTVVFDADPNARGFYEHMGAVVVGWRATPEVPGRSLPQMRYALAPQSAQ